MIKGERGDTTFDDWVLGDWWSFGLILFAILTGSHPYALLGRGNPSVFLATYIAYFKDEAKKDGATAETLPGMVRKEIFERIVRLLEDDPKFAKLKTLLTLFMDSTLEEIKKKLGGY